MTFSPLEHQPIAAVELQEPAEQPSSAPVYVLLRYRRLWTATTLLGGVVGLVLGLMMANSYTSTGTLLLRSGAREAATAESAVGGRDPVETRPFDVIANEMEILTHRDAFHRVIEKVGTDRILEVYDPAAADSAETSVLSRALHRLQTWWFASSSATLQAATPERREQLALTTLMSKLSLRPSGSTMIRVSYEAHSAELAKEVIDAYLAAAEEHHREVYSNRTSLEFLTVMDKQAVAGAQAATDALMQFKQKHGIVDLAVERTALIGDIAKLEAQFAADEVELQAHQSRCAALATLLSGEESSEETITDGPPRDNPECGVLQQQIITLENQQATIRTSNEIERAEMERRIKALDAMIADVRQRLLSIPATLPGPQTRQKVKNPRYERLRSLQDDDELKTVMLQVTHDREAARLAKMRTRLEGLEQIGPAYAALVDEVAKHQDDSRRFLESLKRSELLNLLDENKLSNLRIVEAGELPAQKSGPNRVLRALLGIVFGLMIGLGVAFARDRFDGSVRRAQDLEAVGAGVLGVVPEHRALAAPRLREDEILGDARDRALRRRFDSLWAALLPAGVQRGSRSTIALVGDEDSPGVTTMALHLAARAATALNLEVLLIETNHHHPTLADRLGLGQGPGLRELAAGTASRDEVVRPTRLPGLRIVTAGSGAAAPPGARTDPAPVELLRSLSEGFQVVLLDIPSLVEHPEFRRVAWHADLVVPVFGAGRTTKSGAQGLLHASGSAGKNMPGAILNRWRSVRPFWLPRSLDV